MNAQEEVKSFARDYINGNVTQYRRIKIAEAYRQITHDNLNIHCSTCYIEAIFKIIKHMEKQPCRYRLKKGAVLQAFGDESKLCTNDNLTDELAEWHLKHNPGTVTLFAVMPEPIEVESNLNMVMVNNDKPKPSIPKSDTLPPPAPRPKQTRNKRKK